jgi:hypothetical protein
MKWNLPRSKNVKAHMPGRFVIIVVLLGSVVLTSGTALAQETTVTTANGTWTLFPAIPTTYKTQVNQPINSDGSSNFPAKRGVIPVSFSLSTAPGAAVFQSILSDGSQPINDPATQTTNDKRLFLPYLRAENGVHL